MCNPDQGSACLTFKIKNQNNMNDNLKDVLLPLMILGPLAIGLILFVKTITTYYLKKKMVDKGYVDQESIAIIAEEKQKDNRMSTLKWGLVVSFAGLALIILEFIDYGPESPLPYGIFALSVSLGFLLYFVISGGLTKKED